MVFYLLFFVLAAADPPYRLLSSWGERGASPGQLQGAHGVGIDRDGNVIVTDSRAARVYRFTPEGKFLDEIGAGPGKGGGQFDMPRDARVSPDGKIYVSDGANFRIQVFTHEGKFLRAFGSKGSGPGEFLRAHSLDFDSAGRLYIVDVDNSRVDVYDRDVRYVASWGKKGKGRGEFNACHGIGTDPRGDIFISNYYGPLQKFTPQGRLLAEFAPITPENDLLSYHSLCTDRQGNLYVTTRDRRRRSSIRKYDNQGKLLASWPLPRPEHFVECCAVDPRGRVFVTYQGKGATGVHVYSQ